MMYGIDSIMILKGVVELRTRAFLLWVARGMGCVPLWGMIKGDACG